MMGHRRTMLMRKKDKSEEDVWEGKQRSEISKDGK